MSELKFEIDIEKVWQKILSSLFIKLKADYYEAIVERNLDKELFNISLN
jgi:hypothetical protein